MCELHKWKDEMEMLLQIIDKKGGKSRSTSRQIELCNPSDIIANLPRAPPPELNIHELISVFLKTCTARHQLPVGHSEI